jgi:hypothetical protein
MELGISDLTKKPKTDSKHETRKPHPKEERKADQKNRIVSNWNNSISHTYV